MTLILEKVTTQPLSAAEHMFNWMETKGWYAHIYQGGGGDDSDDADVVTNDALVAIEEARACDFSEVVFYLTPDRTGRRIGWVMMVFVNDRDEEVSDFTVCEELDACAKDFNEYWEESRAG